MRVARPSTTGPKLMRSGDHSSAPARNTPSPSGVSGVPSAVSFPLRTKIRVLPNHGLSLR